jgi:hypothetical protein
VRLLHRAAYRVRDGGALRRHAVARVVGGRWPEYLYNNVPFYSVLPEPQRYPCYPGLQDWTDASVSAPSSPTVLDDDDNLGPRDVSYCRARINEDLPELLDAAERLVERELSYDEALATHFDRLLRFYGDDASRIWSVDDVHLRYVA